MLGAKTFGEVAKLPSTLIKQKFGIWGQQLWLFANGRWQEPLLLEVKDRTTISSSPTLPCDEPDYEAALTFTLSEATRLIGAALGAEALDLGVREIVVGRDGRLSGPKLRDALVAGIRSTGAGVVDIGMVATPLLYFSTHLLGTGSGVEITGSHNPPEYNGLKMVLGGAVP